MGDSSVFGALPPPWEPLSSVTGSSFSFSQAVVEIWGDRQQRISVCISVCIGWLLLLLLLTQLTQKCLRSSGYPRGTSGHGIFLEWVISSCSFDFLLGLPDPRFLPIFWIFRWPFLPPSAVCMRPFISSLCSTLKTHSFTVRPDLEFWLCYFMSSMIFHSPVSPWKADFLLNNHTTSNDVTVNLHPPCSTWITYPQNRLNSKHRDALHDVLLSIQW